MRNLILILFCLPLFAQVPDTNTFSMQDVADEIGVSYSGTTLTELFQLATGQFDPNYVGSKNSLLNFRNYSHGSYRYDGIYIDPPTTAINIEVSQGTTNKYIYYVTLFSDEVTIIEIEANGTNIINTYSWDTSDYNDYFYPIAISFKSPTEMYITYDNLPSEDEWAIYKYNLSVPYRPDLGTVTTTSSIVASSHQPRDFYMSKKNQPHGALLSGPPHNPATEVLKVNTINNSGSLVGATFSPGFSLGAYNNSFCFGNPEYGTTGYSAKIETNGDLTILKRYFSVAYDPSTVYHTETHIIKGLNASSEYSISYLSYYDTNKLLLASDLDGLGSSPRFYVISIYDKLTP